MRAREGADLRTLCEVRSFEPVDGGGYKVHYVRHDPASDGKVTDTAALKLETLSCKHLILSAGTLGTSWLMLRNRAALPGLSDQLGLGFSGNGDLLTFAVRATRENAEGKRVAREIEPGIGPVITSAIRVPDELEGGEGRGFYLEDAGFPQFGGWMLEMLEEPEAIARALPRDRALRVVVDPRTAPQRGRRSGIGAARQLRPVLRPAAAARHGSRHPRRENVAPGGALGAR